MIRVGGLGVPLDNDYLVGRVGRLARQAFDAALERLRVAPARNDD